ncbi:four helix bundle protein [Candidatus Kuenenbacteria bacterium CG_4_9_14_3_um_filter_39_14]|uniref:Four helix bundle protein n=2 Tax=Candidatus Kueneniibacteriota TaxID=1752740 RepID=A0A2H0D0M3_9BACT|nr:MAG: four helix bundle protein [Candidatus Kuenenbacteria bacterium CG22_combo_CG10-13_8_21_14_all_39_9]PJA92208.1 MAG: four helix bundle protein [Candidatus Kuenenbacteria bacterium CG_4_9_14_3_um_filter_39_14]
MENNILKVKIHEFIKLTYQYSNQFPKNELYALTSQLRRAAVSVMLNFLEGYARIKENVKLNFWEISYGSARECKYIIYLAKELKYFSEDEYLKLTNLIDEISAMLWVSMTKIKNRKL